MLFSPLQSWGEDNEIDSKIQMALIYKILAFTNLHYEPVSEFIICYGNSVSEAVLDLNGLKLKSATIKVIPYNSLNKNCHLIIYNTPELDASVDILSIKLKALECNSSNDSHVGIYVKDNKFAFDLDLALAERHKISYELGLVKRATKLCRN